ncbi:uncharacterized protein METZ01_LOCUS207759 [marine metagenome]|uniref:Uncharacterized protein n=1 Tax=marine metagenome TaxID=408172 RepID=A0A382EWP2_9ZZZZ
MSIHNHVNAQEMKLEELQFANIV